MASGAHNAKTAARADYLGGDPVEVGAVSGGQLNVDPAGLRFSAPEGPELRLPLEALLGISISGRAAERSRRALHGTMRVAGMRGEVPAEWRFAIDRSAAAALARQVNRELASRGERPLPHVEEVDGFPLNGNGNGVRAAPEVSRPPSLQLAELGHRLNSLDARRRSRRRPVVPWVILGSALVAVEVVVPLILLSD